MMDSALSSLMDDIVNYWIAYELQFVETPDDVRQALANYNADAPYFVPLVQKDLSRFTYWVFDAQSGQFGPNKFVGFKNMTLPKYDITQKMNLHHVFRGHFNGKKAREAIQKATANYYAGNPQLAERLITWATSLLKIPDAFGGTNPRKWRFLEL